MRTSTKQAIAVLGMGAVILAGFIVWPQFRHDKQREQALAVRRQHIAARQSVPPKGMMPIPAGPMIRGEDDDQIRDKRETMGVSPGPLSSSANPVRVIFLDSFYLDATEVTNKAYRQVADAGKVDPPASVSSATHQDYYTNPEYDDFPVVNVTWQQAKAFCECQHKRLPTEAEWERAARYNNDRLWVWGDGNTWREGKANTLELGKGDTVGATSLQGDRSWYGPYGLIGNVQEWVADRFDPHYYAQSPTLNPTGPTTGKDRVVRGGSYKTSAWEARIPRRGHLPPNASNAWTGFRCAKDDLPKWLAERIEEIGTTQPTATMRAAAGKGRLQLDERVHNFGTVWAGEPVKHTFIIGNSGPGWLEIKDAQATCGCTTLGAISGKVPPGKTWPLPVKVKTESAKGLVARAVHLATDDADRPYVNLYLYGNVRRKIEVTPTKSFFFGTLKRDSRQTHKCTIINNTGTPIQINDIQGAEPWMETALDEREPGRRWEFQVTTKPPLPYGSLVAKIKLFTTLKNHKPITIQVTARVPARVVLQPPAFMLESPVPQKTVRMVQVLNTEGGQVRVTALDSDQQPIKATIVANQAGSPLVRVEVPQGTKIPKTGMKLRIHTDDPDFSELTFSIYDLRRPIPRVFGRKNRLGGHTTPTPADDKHK